MYRERAKRLRAIMARIDKIDPSVVDHVINPSQYVTIDRYSGMDVKFRTTTGQARTARLYGKKGLLLEDMTRDELAAVRDAINREYLDKIYPRSLLDYKTDRPIKRALKSQDIRTKRIGEAISLLDEWNITLDPHELDQDLDLAQLQHTTRASDILNEFYHKFGATEENVITLNAFRIWRMN